MSIFDDMDDIKGRFEGAISKACGKFYIGQKVRFKGEEHEVTDVDEGYDYLALDGDRYIAPNHEDNRCISAPMNECAAIV